MKILVDENVDEKFIENLLRQIINDRFGGEDFKCFLFLVKEPNVYATKSEFGKRNQNIYGK